jgi:hypothetical protein
MLWSSTATYTTPTRTSESITESLPLYLTRLQCIAYVKWTLKESGSLVSQLHGSGLKDSIASSDATRAFFPSVTSLHARPP